MTTRLMRSTTNKVIGGVCGGIAEAFGWDATLVRVGFVVVGLMYGLALPLYLVLWLVMPRTDSPSLAQQAVSGRHFSSFSMPSHNRDRVLGFGLLGFGGLMLASIFHLTGPVFALLVIAAGWYVLNRR